MKIYVNFLRAHTAYQWQVGPLYGQFTKLRYWWRCRSWKDDDSRVTHWRNAVYIGWNKHWRELWDEPEIPQ